MDYEGWVSRAKDFLKNLSQLPGVVESSDSIEPPDRSEYSLEWLRSSRNSLPDDLKEFVSEASQRAHIYYCWSPPQQIIEVIRRIWPEKTKIIGGGDLCEQARYSLYDTSEDEIDRMSGIFKEAEDEVATMFPKIDKTVISESNLEDICQGIFGRGDQGREAGFIPILILPDEARLSLDTNVSDGEAYPVVFTEAKSFDDPIPISSSFQRFLQDWETLCYISPDVETLKPWLNGPGGMLQVSDEKTELLNEIFRDGSKFQTPQVSIKDHDYGGWCARLENFVRRFGKGQGERGISINIAPPAEAKDFDERVAEFSYRVPDALRRFYLEGSGNFKCTFHWSPDEISLKELEKLFPHHYTFWGGLELIPWNELQGDSGYFCYWEDEEEDACVMGKLAIPVWRRTVPLIYIGNGDIIGIYVGEDGLQEKVVFLIHDYPEDSVTLIAESVEEFFEGLERQSYLGMDICSMEEFEGNSDSPSRKGPEILRLLKEILLS